ncbi:MAG: gntP: transporter, gluconate:H+ symporter (GntP) family [Anaerosporomusa subterranea]|jgi:H+/gluconate symporter-like permease|nr:gntP: transporter, gluconate:H+ symporter (GntP) family [Anaerosporomusa subterranea]
MEVIGILLSLFLLMYFAYRGFSVIMFAPIFALLAAVSQGFSIMPSYTELFMGKAVGYVKAYFPVFILGAVFGKVIEDTGLAQSISHAIIKATGKGKVQAIAAVTITGIVLTYGGVNVMVAVFAIYPFGSALFREVGVPKRFLPATMLLGAGTITMDAFPGTPQIQNLIPTAYFGTNAYAAPINGILGGLLAVGLCFAWLRWRVNKAGEEGYGDDHINEPDALRKMEEIDWKLAVLPLVTVLVLNYVMTRIFVWDPNLLVPFQGMKLPLVAANIKNVIAIWALIVAETVAICLALVIGYKNIKGGGKLAKTLNAGAIGSLLAVMNVASEVGYGNVIASLPGFSSIANFLLSIKMGSSPLLSEAVTVNVLAGITGSASGGMSIALDIMGKEWLSMANAIGMSPEILHRVASMASGGMDTLPHNGAIITLLAVCGLNHKQSYGDIFAITVCKTVAAFFVVIFYSLTGLV